MCAYVYAAETIYITSGMILTLYDWLNNFCFLQFYFMALATNIIDKRGPRKSLVTAKEDIGNAVLAIYITAKGILPAFQY